MKTNTNSPNIGVIGAGMVGLSTANLIKDALPKANITIYAEHFLKDTTSNGAAGVYRPCADQYTNNSQEELERWAETSAKYYWQLAESENAMEFGCFTLPMYQAYTEMKAPVPELYSKYVKAFREVTSKELGELGFPSFIGSAHFYYTPMLESRYYLPYLTQKLTQQFDPPARFIKMKIEPGESLKAICQSHDVLVNCCGLGAKELWNDSLMYPLRGQLVRVKAPWLKFGAFIPDSTYFYPGRETVVLGGTRQKNDYELQQRPKEITSIINAVSQYQPSIAKAEILETWCGLRPCRDGIRLETQWLDMGGSHVTPVVHNYGHAAFGISLGHGTAVDACQLVLTALNELGIDVENIPPNETNSKLSPKL